MKQDARKERKIIIFDMDGVIFDSSAFTQRTFLVLHPGVTEQMYKEISTGNFHEEAKKYAHLKIEGTEEEKAQRRISYAETKSTMPMFDGMKNVLDELHRREYILVLNTSAFERNCLPLLEKSGIKDMFDFIATAELSKSKVEKFKMIEDRYNANKKDMLFITDSLGDVREAEIAEIPTIAVTWGIHDNSYFTREKHPFLIGVVDSVDALKSLIQ